MPRLRPRSFKHDSLHLSGPEVSDCLLKEQVWVESNIYLGPLVKDEATEAHEALWAPHQKTLVDCRARRTLIGKVVRFMRGPCKVYERVYERKKKPCCGVYERAPFFEFLEIVSWEALKGLQRLTNSKRISKGFLKGF